MLYIRCPTCRKLLGDKQLYYEKHIDKITQDFEMEKITHDESEKLKQDLINYLLPNQDRYCCRMRLMTYRRLIEFVK